MLDYYTVLAIFQLHECQARASMVINDLWMQESYTGPTQESSSRTSTSTMFCGPDVDDNSDISKTRRLKQFVKTKIGGNVQYGLCNLTLEVEREVSTNYCNEE
jgi:hypothetical protein